MTQSGRSYSEGKVRLRLIPGDTAVFVRADTGEPFIGMVGLGEDGATWWGDPLRPAPKYEQSHVDKGDSG